MLHSITIRFELNWIEWEKNEPYHFVRLTKNVIENFEWITSKRCVRFIFSLFRLIHSKLDIVDLLFTYAQQAFYIFNYKFERFSKGRRKPIQWNLDIHTVAANAVFMSKKFIGCVWHVHQH